MTAATDTTYNGWANYETWAVKLWIDNERSDYTLWRDQTLNVWEDARPDTAWNATRSDVARVHLAELLKEWAEENVPGLEGFYADLLNAALGEVDWFEIANSMLSDTEGYEAQS